METTECAFADDVVRFARNEKQLQNNLDILIQALERKSMKLNTQEN